MVEQQKNDCRSSIETTEKTETTTAEQESKCQWGQHFNIASQLTWQPVDMCKYRTIICKLLWYCDSCDVFFRVYLLRGHNIITSLLVADDDDGCEMGTPTSNQLDISLYLQNERRSLLLIWCLFTGLCACSTGPEVISRIICFLCNEAS